MSIFKDISIKIDDDNLPLIYFSVVFNNVLSIDAFRLEWDRDDAIKFEIEFEENAGRAVGKFIDKEAEQEIVTHVLKEMKRIKWEPWYRWKFDEILKKRINNE